MTLTRMMTAVAAALMLAGCLPVTTKTPVGTTAGLKADPALYGTWKGHDPKEKNQKDGVFHFMKGRNGETEVLTVFAQGDTGDSWASYTITTAKLGGNGFINATAALSDGKPADARFKNTTILLLYTIKAGRLRLYLLGEDAVKKAIAAGKLKGTIGDGENGDVTITSPAAELDSFMATPEAAKLFDMIAELKKVE